MSNSIKGLWRCNRRLARAKWGLDAGHPLLVSLKSYTEIFAFSISSGDLLLLENGWYVTHAGLLRLANRSRCHGIRVQPVQQFCDPSASRFAFEAEVYKSRFCRGFVGYGDADPSNVSPLVHGAEMRVAETRAVNRALRKAYGIGICSVEELGSAVGMVDRAGDPKNFSLQRANGNGYGGPRVRDRLCQIIRQHQLDPTLVKAYATDFCAVKTLRDANRDQVETFVAHLADWAEKDRNALLCQLNSYGRSAEGVA